MSSTFLGLEIGKRSLQYHKTGLNVIGHNLSHADVEGYSRQRIKAQAVEPLYRPDLTRVERPGQIGEGVEIAEVRRDRDMLLETRISTEISKKEYWTSRSTLIEQVESIHQSLGETNLQEYLDRFWAAWQEVAKNPSEPSVREVLIQDAIHLSRGMNEQFRQLNRLQRELDEKIASDRDTINDTARALADINTRILQSEAMEDNPNDLRDERDRLISRLAKIVDIEVNFKDNDEVMVFVGGKVLVQGTEYTPLDLRDNPQNNGWRDIYFRESGDRFIPSWGRLKAYFQLRDEVIKEQIRRLDTVALHLTHAVNDIHRTGFDQYGRPGEDFFDVVNIGPDPFGRYDLDGDGVIDAAMFYELTGTQSLDPLAPLGEDGELLLEGGSGEVIIPYRADEKIGDLITRINASSSGINAYLNQQGHLVLRARSSLEETSFYLRHVEDSGRFLSGTSGLLVAPGPDGAFDYRNVDTYQQLEGGIEGTRRSPFRHPSAWIAVNERISGDGSRVAASAGTDYDGQPGGDVSFGRGDGEIARQIATLRYGSIPLEDKASIDEYYTAMMSEVGVQGKTAKLEGRKYEAILDSLERVRQSISGVNIDEEMANLLAMQHGYQAAARIVTTMDALLDTLINRMAV